MKKPHGLPSREHLLRRRQRVAARLRRRQRCGRTVARLVAVREQRRDRLRADTPAARRAPAPRRSPPPSALGAGTPARGGDVLADGGADLVVGAAPVVLGRDVERAQPLERVALVLPRSAAPSGGRRASGARRRTATAPRTARARATRRPAPDRSTRRARRTDGRGLRRARRAARRSAGCRAACCGTRWPRRGSALPRRRHVLQPLSRTSRVVADRERLDRQRRRVHAIRRHHVAQAMRRAIGGIGRRRRVAADMTSRPLTPQLLLREVVEQDVHARGRRRCRSCR